ncbi:MAG TPA: antibiotic biosynthesis monooxygenase family protein [Nevskiaceae bacterium]|nr:antibiotic biosynthesis monooxygenase family protein [Nevskiaceae bacterium]
MKTAFLFLRRRWRSRLAGSAAVLIGALGLGACSIGTPYRSLEGPAAGGERVVALTHARLGEDAAARGRFWEGVWRVEGALARQPGLVGHRLRRSLLGREVWTMTVWQDEASLEAFVRSPLHQQAMREGVAALSFIETARLRLPAERLPPSWDEAEAALAAQGRAGYAPPR